MAKFDTIIKAIISEKSSNQQSKGRYTFEIKKTATKIDVKRLVKEIYGVEVDKVRIIRTAKKERVVGKGRVWIKRPPIKKAIVSLKDGKTMDPFKLKESKKK